MPPTEKEITAVWDRLGVIPTGSDMSNECRLAAYILRLESEVVRVSPGDACSFGCGHPATDVAKGRIPGHDKPAVYCVDDAISMARSHGSEYVVNCPNCGCMFGVG